MKTIDLAKEPLGLSRIFSFARMEPVLLVMGEEEFVLSRADDFEAEVEAIRNSPSFQKFLDSRMKCKARFAIEDIEKEVDDELQAESDTLH